MKSRTMKYGAMALLGGAALLTLSSTAAEAATVSSGAKGQTIVLRSDDGTVTCRGGQIQWYANPGISFTSGDQTQSFTGTINLNQCLSSKFPDLTSGNASFSATGKGGCPSGVTNGYGRAIINWDNGKSSTAQGSFRATAGAFGFSDARITSGLFQGATGNFSGHPTENWVGCLWGIGQGEGILDYVTLNPVVGTK
jgi:hypothetical protein